MPYFKVGFTIIQNFYRLTAVERRKIRMPDNS